MRVSNWNDYKLIDVTSGERLEQWGGVTLIRPDPQVIFQNPNLSTRWGKADARYNRSKKGGGSWEYTKPLPESWNINYKDLHFKVKPTGFKHTGIFPEQAVNWDYCRAAIEQAKAERNAPVSVLNLFAYTGGATVACACAGANVCHLDAVKGMVDWAKENVRLNNIPASSTRFIVDDAQKFLTREINRGHKYDAIILDPPSYGRGTNGEMWKLEDAINDLMLACTDVLSDNPLFVMLNSYTTGLSPSVMAYLLQMTVGKRFKITVEAEEIGLLVEQTGLPIPCGNTAIASRGQKR